ARYKPSNQFLRANFEADYQVVPTAEPGIEYRDLSYGYHEQRAAAGDLGVAVLEDQELMAGEIAGTFCILQIYRPLYTTGEPNHSVVELRLAFDDSAVERSGLITESI